MATKRDKPDTAAPAPEPAPYTLVAPPPAAVKRHLGAPAAPETEGTDDDGR